jgi:gamma-glutamyltranspeptidase/glutathione hydrolase
LFSDALRLAEDGFNVTPRLSAMALKSKEALKKFPVANEYFSGAVGGGTLSNKPYAETLMHYRNNDFYEGTVSSNIVHAVTSEGGYLSQDDMSVYEVKDREKLCDTYRWYKICSMNEP